MTIKRKSDQFKTEPDPEPTNPDSKPPVNPAIKIDN